MLISQHGELLHTFPRTIFAVKNFTVGGYSCMPDKVGPITPCPGSQAARCTLLPNAALGDAALGILCDSIAEVLLCCTLAGAHRPPHLVPARLQPVPGEAPPLCTGSCWCIGAARWSGVR